ncbi:MAG: (p)ppGpp synthetase [Acidobacteriota bacterium]
MASLDFEREKNLFREYYGSNFQLLEAAENSFRTLIAALLAGNDLFPTPVVTSRLKEREECIRKFALKYQAVLEEQQRPYEIKDYVTDLIGIRVTCFYETDIPHIKNILTNDFETIDITDKSSRMESKDDTFGYKGLHLDLKLNHERRVLPEYRQIQDLRFEVQIRTIIQHAWSELDHKIKYKKSPPASLKRKINRLAALFELADQEFINIRIETEEREKLTRDQIPASLPVQEEEKYLDVFQFLYTAREEFPLFNFSPYKVDGFVQEIQVLSPDFTQSQLDGVLDRYLSVVKEYAEYLANYNFNLNPYTMIRHALYLSNKEDFSGLLFDMQRNNFDRWLREKNIKWHDGQ